jgi:hypothetical protein
MKKANTFLQQTLLLIGFLCFAMHAHAQVKVGTNPTTIEATSNLEVEASTAGRKVKVNKTTGQLTIKDGTEGADKILISDATGGASWKAPQVIGIDKTVFIGRQSAADYLITSWNINQWNEHKDRIPLVSQLGSLPGWNSTTKQYTIQEDGNYRVFVGAYITGTLPPTQTTVATLYLHPWNVLHQYSGINTEVGPVLSVFWEAFMPAGTVVNLYVTSNPLAGGAQNLIVKNGFLSVVKLAY